MVYLQSQITNTGQVLKILIIRKHVMNIFKKSGLAAIMGLLAFSVFASNIAKAETNPFAAQNLVTFAAEETSEGKAKGKCGEGKCGEGKAKAKGKCGEGKCGEGKAKAKGKCGEGKCGEGKAKAKGKCGEGKAKDKKCGG